ncbi:MAG TPA: peptide deformylase [Candidatus Paceibacterota bacterium]|nr:peptide deformylase [Candidatus Paceibacterota bacterium]
MKDPVVQIGSPILRQKAKPVAKKDFGSKPLKVLITKMKKVLDKEKYGVAIAAPQVGVSIRLFVVAGRAFDEDSDSDTVSKTPDKAFINPEIIRVSRKKKEMSEGCLSVRGKYGAVLRHEKATVKAFDEDGKQFIYHGSGLIAHIFQHEIDHLEGVLYIDKAVRVTDDDSVAPPSKK